MTPRDAGRGGADSLREGPREAAGQRRDHARGDGARNQDERGGPREDRRGRRSRRGVTEAHGPGQHDSGAREHLQDAGALAEDHVHVPLPGDLPGGVARRDAGCRRAGDDRLLLDPEQGRRRTARALRPVRGRQPVPRDDLRAGHHALHLGLHLRADRRGGHPDARQDAEGRRGPEEDHAVDALRHRRAGDGAGVGLRPVHRERAGRGADAGLRLQDRDDVRAHRGRDLRDVARRADHRARPRQRRLAHDLLLDRRALLARDRRHLPLLHDGRDEPARRCSRSAC